jgi:hypothetical protein
MAKCLAVALLLLVALASCDGSELNEKGSAGSGVNEVKAPVAGLPVLPPVTGTVTAPVVPVPGIPPARKSTDNKSP